MVRELGGVASALSARAKREGSSRRRKGSFGGQNTYGGGAPYRAAEKPGRMNHREPLSFTDKNQEALRSGYGLPAALPIFHVTITIFLCFFIFLFFLM